MEEGDQRSGHKYKKLNWSCDTVNSRYYNLNTLVFELQLKILLYYSNYDDSRFLSRSIFEFELYLIFASLSFYIITLSKYHVRHLIFLVDCWFPLHKEKPGSEEFH